MEINSKLTNLIFHILFWTIVALFIANNSFLRPYIGLHKELLCLALIIIMIYFNYLYLIPKFFQTARLIRFYAFAALAIAIAGLSEFLLAKPIIYQCYGSNLPPAHLKRTFLTIMFLIIVRDLCFFLFFFLLKLYRDISKRYLKEKQSVAKKEDAIFITLPYGDMQELRISDIVYLSQERNKTLFHLLDGKIYEQYSSLSSVEKIIDKEAVLKINKSNMVMLSQIVNFRKDCISLNLTENGKQVQLPISSKEKEHVLEVLANNTSNMFSLTTKNSNVRTKNSKVKDENGNVKRKIVEKNIDTGRLKVEKEEHGGVRKKASASAIPLDLEQKQTFDYITQHPGCGVSAIAEHICKSYRSTERCLKKMREIKLIEFRGSARNGGYYVKNNQSIV